MNREFSMLAPTRRSLVALAMSATCCLVLAGCASEEAEEVPAVAGTLPTSSSAQPSTTSAPSVAAFPKRSELSGIVVGHYQGQGQPYEIGLIDPINGNYRTLGEFDGAAKSISSYGLGHTIAMSPDFTKIAANKAVNSVMHPGWYDMDGYFADLTPELSSDEFGTDESASVIGFDANGRIYWTRESRASVGGSISGGVSTTVEEVYRADPDNLSASRETVPVSDINGNLYRDFSGSLSWEDTARYPSCRNSVYSTLAPDTYFEVEGASHNDPAQIVGTQIYRDSLKNLPAIGSCGSRSEQAVPLLPDTSSLQVTQPIPNHDGSKVAFFSTDGTLYTVDGYGRDRPTRVANGFQNFVLIEWLP
ncbi:hypothetical protein LCL87_17030 [Rhodococcus hoagii]|nr:hypothetical protein [Prescottella equi]